MKDRPTLLEDLDAIFDRMEEKRQREPLFTKRNGPLEPWEMDIPDGNPVQDWRGYNPAKPVKFFRPTCNWKNYT